MDNSINWRTVAAELEMEAEIAYKIAETNPIQANVQMSLILGNIYKVLATALRKGIENGAPT